MIVPHIQVLETKTIERVLEEAYTLLMDPGVKFDTEAPLELLAESGAEVDFEKEVAHISPTMIDQALKTIPPEITFYDLNGEPCMVLGGDQVYYYPGSTAMKVWDADKNLLRHANTQDMLKFIKICEGLPNCDALSSTFFCQDVPAEVADSYRIYLLLKNATKPFVTGAFSVEGQQVELDLLTAFRGTSQELERKPLAVMTAAPSPVLKWSLVADFVLMCAKTMVPMGIGPMPLACGNGPATLIGTLVQHTAEALSGCVIAQLARAGAPVLWFSPTGIFDVRHMTSCLGAIETHLIHSGATEIGKYLNIPTFSYMGISDSKTIDEQFAMETTFGNMMATLSQTNLNGSLGMLNFESAQSFEGLVISHEAASIARRLARGIDDSMPNLGADLIRSVGFSGDFLSTKHTLQWYKKEFYYPDLYDRQTEAAWQETGSQSMLDRARQKVDRLVGQYKPPQRSPELVLELEEIMCRAAAKYGMNKLPA
jgi:trimethylamine--corrinoid protein Co-methyltransferase